MIDKNAFNAALETYENIAHHKDENAMLSALESYEAKRTPEPEASKRQLREDFEKWYGSKPSRFITGNYEDVIVQARWEAYKTGRESVSTPAPVSGWQPIETAPKDGTSFLTGGHIAGKEIYKIRKWGGKTWQDQYTHQNAMSCEVWMPIPSYLKQEAK